MIMIQDRLRIFVIIGTLAGCAFNPKAPPSITSTPSEQLSKSDLSCLDHPRLLNPNTKPQTSETELDRYFRLAFDAETEGNFTGAINFYQKASEIATCACDRQHASAGKQAANEAQNLIKKEGAASKPTQFFWGRLQALTQSLPCIQHL
jgi:hypothetical protein